MVSNGFLGIKPKVQTTKVKIDNRYNEILFSHKKEIKFWPMLQNGWILKTLCWDTKGSYYMIHLHEMSRVDNSTEIENRSEVFRDWAEQGMERHCDWV